MSPNTPIFGLRALCTSLFTFAAIAGPASALTTTYNIVSGGLDDGHACLSSAGAGTCATSSVFSVEDSFAATGTIIFDDATNLVDIDITLTTSTMVGSLNGVTEVVFTTTQYVVDDWATFSFGNQILGLGIQAGSAVGTYTQLDATDTVVGGPTPFVDSTQFSALSCIISGTNGQCGFTVGALRDLSLPVSGQPVDFRQTFNVGVSAGTPIPEPSAALVFALGMVVVGRRAARR
jgi:hypothetical protein